MTIHQPNSLITSLFDDFMLLGAGKLLYYGPWEQAVDFFSTAGCAHTEVSWFLCYALYLAFVLVVRSCLSSLVTL